MQARVQAHETRSVQNGSTPSNQDSASPNTRLMRMVQQVKEVLPQVPSPSIARDLSKLAVCNLSQSCPVLIKGTNKRNPVNHLNIHVNNHSGFPFGPFPSFF